MKTVLFELVCGKGIWRALLYGTLRSLNIRLEPRTIDIACGKNPGYWRILGLDASRITAIDSNPATNPSCVHDVGALRLPYSAGDFKSAIFMNAAYAFADPLSVLREIWRVLEVNGTALMSFPLVFPYTPEPHDFYRFTDEGVRRVCSDAGFAITAMRPIGGRWSSAVYLIEPFLRPRLLFAVPISLIALLLDRITYFFFPAVPTAPIGYLVVLKKI